MKLLSVRNYNSTRTYERFPRRSIPPRKSKKNIDYTEVYKVDGIPSHNVEAVNQFHEKREEYQRMQNMLKRKQEREMTENKKKKTSNNIGENLKRKLPTHLTIEKIKNRKFVIL